MKQEETMEEQDELRNEVQPFIDALYKEHSEHKSCDYDFGCIIESITLWRIFHKILSSLHHQDCREFKKIIGEDEGKQKLSSTDKAFGISNYFITNHDQRIRNKFRSEQRLALKKMKEGKV